MTWSIMAAPYGGCLDETVVLFSIPQSLLSVLYQTPKPVHIVVPACNDPHLINYVSMLPNILNTYDGKTRHSQQGT